MKDDSPSGAAPAAATQLSFDAVIFDLDGVVTRTADLHAAAWKEAFDDFLRAHVASGQPAFPAFDPVADYLAYVDGKPRHEGVHGFLAARGIQLVEGNPSDGPDALTVYGIGAHKDALFTQRMRRDGVTVFASTVALVRTLRERGVKTAVVTSSRNGREVLRVSHTEELFDARVDGIDAAALGLKGKPHPDPFLRAAELLEVRPGHAVVIEDATSGVEAGRRGGFGLVVGVDRGGNRDALLAHGADVVVADLEELDVPGLERRVRARREEILAWAVEQEGFDPAREHGMESIFTVGNGYLGVRGSLDTPMPGSQSDLFLAGVYDRKHPEQSHAEAEAVIEETGDHLHSELVSAPFPFRIRLAMDGVALDPVSPRCHTHRRTLELRGGVLRGYADYDTDVDRRVIVETRRCASLAELHLLLQEVTVCAMNHSGLVELDTSIADPNLATDHPHLAPLPADPDDAQEVLRFTTRTTGVEVCMVSRTFLEGERQSRVRWRVPAPIGRTLSFRRYVAIFTGLDASDPLPAARRLLERVRWDSFDEAVAAHAARWSQIWARADVRIPGSPATEQALRFNTYHLISAADRNPRVSVGARALTGRAYNGHVFWDLEMFKLPFYLHIVPDVARCLVLYRHHTLDGARRRARELGLRGASYAWESTVTGDDVTPRSIRLRTTGEEIPIFTGTQQIHITSAVAHAVWRYWEATRDRELMRSAGVEILIETARFWASRATAEAGRFHLRGVMGPDEYHFSVNDNAYTNWMARDNLTRAIEAVEWMKRDDPGGWGALAERLGVPPDEPAAWDAVARALVCPGPNAQGVIEQFEGFFDLEDFPLPREERIKAPIHRLFDWKRINRTKMIKQADVLMLMHVLPGAFPREVVTANYHYYEPITDHMSSLSPGIHAAIAARIGLCEDAERYWRESLWLDLSDRMGNAALGVHPACMGATWQALVFGFLGVRLTEAGPVRDPGAAVCLPPRWQGAALSLVWRDRLHNIEVSRQEAP